MRLLDVVHVGDRSVSFSVLRKTDEAETTAATGVAVLDDNLRLSVRVAWGWVKTTYGFLDLAKLFELGAKSAIVGVPCEATVVAS